MRIYIGWDPVDALAWRVAKASILAHASIEVEIAPLSLSTLRRRGIYWRTYFVDPLGQKWDSQDGQPFSTEFSYSRFLVPCIENFADDLVLFVDADVMFRRDVADLVAAWSSEYSVMCCKHDYRPSTPHKALGRQRNYLRKNWSSVMLLNPARCALGPLDVNNRHRDWLHGFQWVPDAKIGALDLTWNQLYGEFDATPAHDDQAGPAGSEPAVVHFTLGTPDMIAPGSAILDSPLVEEWVRHAENFA